jgi:hydroxymethylpyrimidine pyrophosphatase-like HAD family hydrolase
MKNYDDYRVICVDFDGCLADDPNPDMRSAEIGEPIWETINAVKSERAAGSKIILWTCRVGDELDAAVKWCAEHDIYFDVVNGNLPEYIERFGGDTRKPYATEYWDDKAVRMPCGKVKL